jgi:hypothetical protein
MNTTSLEHISALRRDIRVHWLVPDRVIFASGAGSASPEVREWMNARIVFLMHSCSTPQIHLVCDVRQMIDIPLRSLLSPVLRHPRLGWFISVGRAEPYAMTLALRLIARMTVVNYRSCSRLEDALTLLQQADPTLPDLQAYRAALLVEPSS